MAVSVEIQCRVNRDTTAVPKYVTPNEKRASLGACQTEKQTRNQNHYLEGNVIPAGCNVTCSAPRVKLTTVSILTIGRI